jgi:uncharacterized peroxidase-related enzyme
LALRGEAVNSGRTLQAIRDNELRAEALGVPTFALQIVSSTFASVVAAVVSGCYLMWVRHVNPESVLGVPVMLSKVRKELIATAVSVDNGCRHCTQLHGGFLGRLTTDQGLVFALMTDPATAPLHGADRALITYALKLTRTPRELRESDVAALRAAGFSDTEIFEAAFVTASFSYTNRVAGSLGIEPEG